MTITGKAIIFCIFVVLIQCKVQKNKKGKITKYEFLCAVAYGDTSNLVPNGSFENYSSLILNQATGTFDFDYVCYWNKRDSTRLNPNEYRMQNFQDIENILILEEPRKEESMLFLGTPDYYRYDDANAIMKRVASDSTGYAGINILGTNATGIQRGTEYLQVKLKKHLKAGRTYSVSFDYQASDKFGRWKSYSSNALGFIISDSLVHKGIGQPWNIRSNLYPLAFSKYVLDSVPSQNVWKKAQWIYEALGNEEFLVIGDLRCDSLDYLIPDPYNYACYFLIDNVVVEEMK